VRDTVVIVAPLALDREPESLGARAKLEVIIGILLKLGFRIHLVDSTHPRLPAGSFWERSEVAGKATIEGAQITWSRPFTVANRRLGKLLNILFMRSLVKRLAALNPCLVWIYNAYAFEGRLAIKLSNRCRIPILLELEDLPLARHRRLNPKPYLDEYYFRRLMKKVSLITYVNHVLMQRYGGDDVRKLLLPSVLGKEFSCMPVRSRFLGPRYLLGYFGGLEIDKGAEVLLKLVAVMPEPWHLIVTGRGTLQREFEAAAAAFPERFTFLGVVERAQMISEMARCDAIINPHRSIAAMGDGVFPFKVCESIATGALLLSTRLPEIDIDTSRGVLFFDGSLTSMCEALGEAKRFYDGQRKDVETLRSSVCERFGLVAVEHSLAKEISELVTLPSGKERTITTLVAGAS